MKQQARERELELSSLTYEREEMRIKLATLQVRNIFCSVYSDFAE